MRNIETRITKTGPDDAGLNQMLTDARMEERRGRADVFAAHLEKLAVHITAANSTAPKPQSYCVTQLKLSRTKHRRSTDG